MIERSTLARVLPFAAYMLFIAAKDVLAWAGVVVQDARWMYLPKIAVVLALLLYFRREYRELSLTWRQLAWPGWVLALAVGIAVWFAWINLHMGWMIVGKMEGVNWVGTGTNLDWALIVVRLTGAALIVPVMEELFWRSFLLRWIENNAFLTVDPARIGWVSMLTTAAVFGIEHQLWLAGLLAGLAYNALYRHSQNLWSPVCAHAVTNGILGGWVLVTGNWSYW